MPFDWGDFLELAAQLADDPADDLSDARLRSRISRAYYASYHAALDYCRGRARSFPYRRNRSTNHRLVPEYLEKLGQLQAADDLKKLRRWRNQADYDSEYPGLEAKYTDALMLARRVARSFES